jgi:hypothetical protein
MMSQGLDRDAAYRVSNQWIFMDLLFNKIPVLCGVAEPRHTKLGT